MKGIVIGFLFSIIISALSQYMDNCKASYIIQSAYIILSLFNIEFWFMFPMITYDIIQNENKFRYIKFTFIIPLIFCFLLLSITNSLVILACTIISALLSQRTYNFEQIKKKLILQRDSLEENKILLTERNKYLINSRDYEIDLAILTERARIAREIHDNVGHMLSRTLLQMGAVKIINTDEKIVTQLDDINNSINTAMTSIRESVHNLHDNAVQLENTIKEIVNPLVEKYLVKLDIDISEKAPKEIKLCIIGIVKEAVSNIIKHSTADYVNIVIREHPGFYQIVVKDNGINSGKINEGGIGLENMKNRAEKFNGIFKYYVEKNSFKVFVSIPKKGKFEL